MSWLLAFDHVTLGSGVPVAVQESVTSLLSFNVWFLEILMMLGRTENNSYKRENRLMVHENKQTNKQTKTVTRNSSES